MTELTEDLKDHKEHRDLKEDLRDLTEFPRDNKDHRDFTEDLRPAALSAVISVFISCSYSFIQLFLDFISCS